MSVALPQELQSPISALSPDARQLFDHRMNGAAGRATLAEYYSTIEMLNQTGQNKPSTVINFNPIALRAPSPMSWAVPGCTDRLVKDEDAISIEFQGQIFRGSVLTVRTPYLWPKVTTVERDQTYDVDQPKHAIRHIPPIGVTNLFHEHYVQGAKDAQGMGGILIFEGDRHVLGSKYQKESEGTILVPNFKLLPNKTRAYFSERKLLKDVLKEIFGRQRSYVNQRVREAQGYFDGPDDQRNNITNVHRIWGQFAMDMKWRDKPYPWMTEDLGEQKEVVKCTYCSSIKQDAEAHFCQKCNAPYDAFKTFMAGLVVPEAYLQALTGEQRTKVIAELKRRREGFEQVAEITKGK